MLKISILIAALVGSILLDSCGSSRDVSSSGGSWYTKLPACPCENPDKNGVVLNDGWARDGTNLDKYHNGAAASYRSYPYVKTSEGKSGQQCCYDKDGKLIKSGSGAGTPDKVATCRGEKSNGKMKVTSFAVIGHYFRDVKPWDRLGGRDSGWVRYNKLWVPDQGIGCENK
jgi:AMOP domain